MMAVELIHSREGNSMKKRKYRAIYVSEEKAVSRSSRCGLLFAHGATAVKDELDCSQANIRYA
jgi:hypothetical protein